MIFAYGIQSPVLKLLLVSSNVSKIQLFLLSLVGAGPAGYLTYLLCMYLIDQPSGANSMVMIISILTVLCTAPLTLLPFLILALYFSNYDPPKKPKATKKKAETEEPDDADETIEEDQEFDDDQPAKSKSKNKKQADDDDDDIFAEDD